MKKLLFFLLLVALGLAGVAYVMNNKSNATTLPPRHERVERGNVVEKVPATGRIVPDELVYVSTDVALGRVTDIHPDAKVNNRVEKDQTLLHLDDSLLHSKVDEAEAAVIAAESLKVQAEAKKKTAEAGLRKASTDHDYAKKKLEQGRKAGASEGILNEGEALVNAAKEGINVADAQIKEAESGILAAEANIKKAKAGLSAAQHMLSFMTVKAPVSGTIIDKRVTKGQLVSAQATPVLFVIVPDLNKMELLAQVAEADINKVKKGMMARFTVDAYAEEGTQFKAEVTQVPNVPTSIPSRALEGLPGLSSSAGLAGPVFYTVTLTVLPDEGKDARPLKSGLTANVDFIVKEVSNVLKVPNAALNYRPDGLLPDEQKRIQDKVLTGWKPLWVYGEGSAPRLVFVKTGATDGGKTEILEVDGNLEADMEVITDNPPQSDAGGGLFNLRSLRLG